MTDYLRVPNWEKHQHRDHAGKKNRPWLKLEATIFDDAAIVALTAAEFRAYIRALTLAARTGNRLPADPSWLRAHFGRNWRQLCSHLVSASLLHGTIPPEKPLQNTETERGAGAVAPRLEERRGRGEQDQPLLTTDPVDVDEPLPVLVDGWTGKPSSTGAGSTADHIEALAARASGRVVDLASRRGAGAFMESEAEEA